MNRKTVLILRQLMDGKLYKVAELAEYLEISPRLVRYEMDEANAFLEREGFRLPRYEGTEGMRMTLDQEQRAKLERKLAGLSAYDYVMTSAERRCIMLLLMLAKGGRRLTGQYFADQMSVSKSSINKDMIRLKADLTGSGVRLESRAGKGSSLEGGEQDIRRLGVQILESHVNFTGICQGTAESTDMVERWARELFCDGIVQILVRMIRRAEKDFMKKWLTWDSFRMIVLNLAVALTRIREGRLVTVMPVDRSLVKATREYRYAEQIAEMIHEEFQLRLPKDEVCVLSFLLISAEYVMPEPYLKEDWVEVQLLMDCLVHEMNAEMGIDFAGDEELCKALQTSLGSTVFRLRYGIAVRNPGMPRIRQEYAECFEALERALARLNSELLKGITEDDIAGLVLHFCASLERCRRSMPAVRTAVVCMHGTGTANLLRELVRSRFRNICVADIVTCENQQMLEPADVDFVITGIPLTDCPVPWVKVSPIPDEEEWERIEEMILQYGGREQNQDNAMNIFEDVVRVVQTHCEIQDMDAFTAGLADCLESNGLSVCMDRIQPSLSQLLKPQYLRCRREAGDWEDAVGQACEILVNAGDVTEEFAESAVNSVKNAGPYIVIMPGVALVHGEVGKGVKRLAMSLITLKVPVCFHHPSNDPVYLVFCLAPVDNWSHIQALRGLLRLLESVAVHELCGADTPRKLYQYLEEGNESYVH